MSKGYVTPPYIKSLLLPNAKSRDRRVWSIGLETTLIPFFTATNTMGDTAIPSDALGCPIRLAFDKDGSVKFSKAGRPVTKVAKAITQQVKFMRDNYIAVLADHTEKVITAKPAEYRKQVELAQKAGQPITAHDRAELDKAIQLQLEEATRQAQEEALSEATKAPSVAEKDKELVTAQ